jgi:hypothetical protein
MPSRVVPGRIAAIRRGEKDDKEKLHKENARVRHPHHFAAAPARINAVTGPARTPRWVCV